MKKVLIGVAGLLVIVVGALVFVWSSLDGLVKDAIETYGSEATKTQVRVADVKIALESGAGKVSGLRVGNPSGFSDPDIFSLGMISTKIDTSTVTQNPVVIDEIIIKSPAVFYEINKSGTSNVDVLKKNLGQTGGRDSSAARASGSEEMKMIIRKLVVENGKATVRIAALGGKEQTVTLPRIKLTDVGKKSGGATAAEVAQILGKHLVKNVKGSVAKLGVKQYLGKSADLFKGGVLDKAGQMGGGLGGALGGATGGAGEKVGGALKGLLGN
ncbi:MAG: hypothetical protein ACE5F3_01570 [Mariprofundaceae bacterium]